MSGAVRLPGVRAQTPMGLLVALGTLDVLTERIDAGTRLAWSEEGAGQCATIVVADAGTSDDVAGLVLDAVAGDPLDAVLSLARDLNQVAPDALHDALSHALVPRVLCGLCAEAPLRAGGQVAMTPLAIASFQGRRSVFGTLLRTDADLTEEQLRALFGGPWTYARNVTTLNLDPASREQDSARMFADASADGTRGVAGALSLAVRGLSLIPPLPACSGRGRRPRVAAVHGTSLVWPVWRPFLTRFGVRALMGRAWGAIGFDAAAMQACGVTAVYGSQIVAAKDGRRLARATRRA